MFEIIFLIVLAFIWISFAVIQDSKKREVANWLNFSLIIFALGFRFFYCLFFSNGFNFFYQGLIGLGIFFVLGNLFYYGRMFAGGDAKLMIAFGTILPLSESFLINLQIFILFLFIFLFAGAFYGLTWSFILTLKNFKKCMKEFPKQLMKNKKLIYLIMFIGVGFMILGFIENLLFFSGIFFFILPLFYVYAKTVDEVCMIKKITSSQLTEGDWIYHDLKIGNKIIKASWDGLTKDQIRKIKKNYKFIKVRKGIPFTPVFLFSFLILFYFWFNNLINILW